MPPAWHQWLRYQRAEPPTLQEQSVEAMRQERIKVLAAEADARWKAKPSLLDMPAGAPKKDLEQPRTEELGREKAEIPRQKQAQGEGFTRAKTDSAQLKVEDPWKKAQRGVPGETWQPEAWSPAASKKR